MKINVKCSELVKYLLLLLFMPGIIGCPPREEPTGVPVDIEIGESEVLMQLGKFVPEERRIKSGSTVTWINRDNAKHTVTRDMEPVSFHSGELNPGDRFEFTFEKAGEYDYECTIHPKMQGTIIVE